MKQTLKTAPLVAALCLLAWPLQAADGILIVEKSTANGVTKTNQIQIEKNRLRTETELRGEKQVIVFDGTTQVMRMINTDKMTYSEISKAEIDQLGAQLQGAMAQMQAQMANLPPAARAQMEAMMRGRGGLPAAPAKTEYRKTGTDRVGKWTCDKYDGFQDNQKTSEICTVDPKAVGFAASDFDVTKEMAAFFSTLVPQNAGQMFAIGQADQGYTGIPVRRTYTILNVQTTTEITDVTRQNFPDASYAVPAGFTKQDNPFAPPAAGRRDAALDAAAS